MSDFNRRQFLEFAAALGISANLATTASTEDRTAKPKIKIGQIGVGHAHASKLSVYRASADYEVVGIVEPNEKLRSKAQSDATYRDLPWMTQEQLLNVPGLQAVLVETEVRDLLNTAETCIAAGKHVHLDKPAGELLPQYQRLLEAAAQKKLLIQMGYMFRYNPGVVLLRECLKNGWLGEIFEVHTVMSKVVGDGARRELAEYPGGIMFELGCHVIDLVIGVLGKPTQVTAFAHQVAKKNDKLVDNMLAVLNYERAIATVKSSAVEVDGGDRRHFVACGTEGTLHIQPLDNPSVRVAFSKPHGDFKAGYQDVRLPKYARYVGDAADMARIIRGEKASDFSYEHDLTVQDTVLSASGVATDK